MFDVTVALQDHLLSSVGLFTTKIKWACYEVKKDISTASLPNIKSL